MYLVLFPTISIDDALAIRLIGVRALFASKSTFWIEGTIVYVPETISSVLPSGAAFETAAAAIVPAAPGLSSTTTTLLSSLRRSSATTRANTSVTPPAENPTTILIGGMFRAVAAGIMIASINA